MTFLELVQRLHSETARQGVAPSTVISQSGMNARLVNWIQTAYEDVQSEHETWFFRREPFTFPTIILTQNYSKSSIPLPNLAAFRVNPDPNRLSGICMYASADANDETDLSYVPWDRYRETYQFGSFRNQIERPTVCTLQPDTSLEIWPSPDAVYTVSGEYYLNTQVMVANDDEPIFPDYHMIIVWKALMYYGAFEGAPEVYAHGQNQYDLLLSKLEITQLPKMSYGPSLA